jgi:hypothetical protein
MTMVADGPSGVAGESEAAGRPIGDGLLLDDERRANVADDLLEDVVDVGCTGVVVLPRRGQDLEKRRILGRAQLVADDVDYCAGTLGLGRVVAVIGVVAGLVPVHHAVAVDEQLIGVAVADCAVAVGVDPQAAIDDGEVVARAEGVVVSVGQGPVLIGIQRALVVVPLELPIDNDEVVITVADEVHRQVVGAIDDTVIVDVQPHLVVDLGGAKGVVQIVGPVGRAVGEQDDEVGDRWPVGGQLGLGPPERLANVGVAAGVPGIEAGQRRLDRAQVGALGHIEEGHAVLERYQAHVVRVGAGVVIDETLDEVLGCAGGCCQLARLVHAVAQVEGDHDVRRAVAFRSRCRSGGRFTADTVPDPEPAAVIGGGERQPTSEGEGQHQEGGHAHKPLRRELVPYAAHDTLAIRGRVLDYRSYVDGGLAAILSLAGMPR